MHAILCTLIGCLRPQARKVSIVIDTEAKNDWKTFRKVRKALVALEGVRHAILELEITGVCRMSPTVLLSIRDLLTKRPSCVNLRIIVSTNLCDGTLLLPLLADELEIRNDAWFQFAMADDILSKMEKPEKDGEGWKSSSRNSRVGTIKEPSGITDHRKVCSILGEYLPLSEFKGKRLPLQKTLEEHHLMPDPVREQSLAAHFNRTHSCQASA
jgi:hypothetical protein